MTSQIRNVHVDLILAIKAIRGISNFGRAGSNLGHGSTGSLFYYVNVWDEQIDEELKQAEQTENKKYSFNTPAIFIEFIPGECKMLGGNVSSYPGSIVRLHIIHNTLDGNGDLASEAQEAMERNLTIFVIRDLVKIAFGKKGFGVRHCSSLMCCEDVLDYKHNGTYKYLLSYNFNFIDSKGSMFDSDSGLERGVLDSFTLDVNFGEGLYIYSDGFNPVTLGNSNYVYSGADEEDGQVRYKYGNH